MKYFLIAAALLTVSLTAQASFLGMLVSSQSATSITGKLVYKCTYNVMGNNTTVILDYFCPVTMQFD
jgi:hypothetical protein